MSKQRKTPEKALFSRVSILFLGYQGSNLEMLESESSALPFGDSPMSLNQRQNVLYTNLNKNASLFLQFFGLFVLYFLKRLC